MGRTALIRSDLHTHTTASDGLDSPAQLVKKASERGIRVLAITDHDTVDGVGEALAAGADLNLQVVSGVEFSARARRGETHILGYGVDAENSELKQELSELRQGREERGARILERLAELGIHVPATAVEASGSHGRPHIARALIGLGVVETIDQAFEQYLAVGRPAFVPRPTLSAQRAIELILASGGVPVLAHPFSVHSLDDRLPEFLDSGLEGLEAYYGAYSSRQRCELVEMARANGLLVTGGSDYHGPNQRELRDLGSVVWPQEDLEALLERLG